MFAWFPCVLVLLCHGDADVTAAVGYGHVQPVRAVIDAIDLDRADRTDPGYRGSSFGLLGFGSAAEPDRSGQICYGQNKQNKRTTKQIKSFEHKNFHFCTQKQTKATKLGG
jgi:hypothetical protein